jgi:hypothetical protein
VPRPADPLSYAYLFGLYLGDGHLQDTGWTWQLRISLDARYPAIVEECTTAMLCTLPEVRPGAYGDRDDRVLRVSAGSKDWPPLFPQAGPGRKHERPIVLEAWQRQIVWARPEAFTRGLLHSDGCRTVNRFGVQRPAGGVTRYAYPRWFFTNHSADIRALFCAACDRLGVRWTQSSRWNISVSQRASVALLDRVAGPKC